MTLQANLGSTDECSRRLPMRGDDVRATGTHHRRRRSESCHPTLRALAQASQATRAGAGCSCIAHLAVAGVGRAGLEGRGKKDSTCRRRERCCDRRGACTCACGANLTCVRRRGLAPQAHARFVLLLGCFYQRNEAGRSHIILVVEIVMARAGRHVRRTEF